MPDSRDPGPVEGIPVVWFETPAALWAWLEGRSGLADDPGVWVRLTKARDPRPCITFHELLEAGIAFGWSESTRRRFDAGSYLQRFSPRRATGTSSPRNLAIARRLEEEGRMRPAGRAALGGHRAMDPAALVLPGVHVPDGHRLVSLATRPDLGDPMSDFNVAVWPPFMLDDPVVNEHWGRAVGDWPDTQLVLLDANDAIAATANTSPLAWDGTDEGLPTGMDGQFLAAVAGHAAGTPPDTLGAVQIIVDPARRGTGLADLMLAAVRGSAVARGYRAVIACVRPTWKARYPLAPIERYARWTRSDGQPFDPWIRLHLRAGGRMARPEPASMRITGTVAEWESWTGMAFPESGAYVVPGAAAVVHIDRDADLGSYHDPNIWIVHDVR